MNVCNNSSIDDELNYINVDDLTNEELEAYHSLKKLRKIYYNSETDLFESIFMKFIMKHTPKNPWTKLVLYTRSNGKLTKFDARVPPGQKYNLGLVITKIEDGEEYHVVSRTIEDGKEKINTDAYISKTGFLFRGDVNLFSLEFSRDTAGGYHKNMFKEFNDMNEIKWDEVL